MIRFYSGDLEKVQPNRILTDSPKTCCAGYEEESRLRRLQYADLFSRIPSPLAGVCLFSTPAVGDWQSARPAAVCAEQELCCGCSPCYVQGLAASRFSPCGGSGEDETEKSS